MSRLPTSFWVGVTLVGVLVTLAVIARKQAQS